jgi:nitrate reductase NapAB chaperone NapD
MDFAKIFNTEKGQILAVMDTNDNGDPAITVSASPSGLGVCSSALVFHDSDEGYEQQEKAFSDMTEDVALSVAQPIFDMALAMGA